MRSIFRMSALLGAAAALASCDMMGDGPSTQRMEAAIESFELRVDAHHEAVLMATDVEAVRQELAAYTADLRPIFREMMETCDGIMREMMGGLVADEDYNLHADFMMGAIRDHVSAMESAPDLASMKQLCHEHHLHIQAIARHMRTMLEMMKRHMS